MKVLRFLLILILILVVGYLVLCAVSAKEINVEKSTTINAPTSVVWDQMVHFKNWENWNPWEEMDSTITNTYTGNDGEPGSTSHYVGKTSGEGIMTNTGVNGMTMTYDMHFLKPFEAMTKGTVSVSEENGVARATQTFHQDVPFMMRGLSAIMGGEKMIDSAFGRGLQLLKTYAEAHASTTSFDITETQFPATTYATIRQVVKWSDMQQFFGDAYGKLASSAGNRINGMATALYYKWDTENQQGDLAAAFPVSGTDDVKGAIMEKVAASPAYMIAYKGGYSGSAAAHEALGNHVIKSGKTQGLVIEEYLVGPPTETDSSKFLTKIYYLVK